MEFSLPRATYDWLLVMEDGTFAVAHGRKDWATTEQCIQGVVRESARLTRLCKATPTASGWDITKGDLRLGSIRPHEKPGYGWETSNADGEWSPTRFLSGAAKGWKQIYQMAEGTWVVPVAA